MDENISENDKNLKITAEHAVLIPLIQSVKSIMSYVEAVAVVIGSCHIHSVIEDREYIKIYLNDKRFVDVLVNNGVTIAGRRMNVDYAIPRADKIILSNVDPIIPDAVLMKLLCFYGTPVSTIIHEKIASNSEYSHIECGKRKVYIKLFDDKKVPTKINFTYQEVCYQIDMLVEQYTSAGACEPELIAQADRSDDEVQEVESNQSMKSNVNSERTTRKPTPKQLAWRNRGKESADSSAHAAAKQIKRRATKGWFSSRKVRRIGKGKRLIVKKAIDSHLSDFKEEVKRKQRSRNSVAKAPIQEISIADDSNSVDEGVETNGGFSDKGSVSNYSVTDEINDTIIQYPLSSEDLGKFMLQTRFHREPWQVALEFLTDKTPEGLSALKSQLLEYYNVCKEQAVRLRIKRVMVSLKNAKFEETIN